MAALYLHASTLAGSDSGLLNYNLCCAASFLIFLNYPIKRVVSPLTNQLRLVNHGEPAVHWFNLRSQGRPRGIGPCVGYEPHTWRVTPLGELGILKPDTPYLGFL